MEQAEKKEETDIRKKYSHASENNIKSKNKFDYVERVRENSDNVMQSVDLKMMGKFLDEQKKKQSIKEKTKKENKINKGRKSLRNPAEKRFSGLFSVKF